MLLFQKIYILIYTDILLSHHVYYLVTYPVLHTLAAESNGMLTLTYPVPNRQWLPTDRDRIGRSSNGIWTPTTLKAQTPSDSMIRLPLDQWVPGRRIRFAVCSTNCGNFVRQREGLSGVFQWLPVVRGGICAPGVLASTAARPHCTVVCQYHLAGNTGASHHGLMDIKDLGVQCARAAQRWIRF